MPGWKRWRSQSRADIAAFLFHLFLGIFAVFLGLSVLNPFGSGFTGTAGINILLALAAAAASKKLAPNFTLAKTVGNFGLGVVAGLSFFLVSQNFTYIPFWANLAAVTGILALGVCVGLLIDKPDKDSPSVSRTRKAASLTLACVPLLLVSTYLRNIDLLRFPDPRGTLEYSIGPEDNGHYLTRTAAALNARHQGKEWGSITYVEKDIPSTGPYVVSVNPIDQHTWGAVALDPHRHRCFAILLYSDPNNAGYGGTLYGELPSDKQCAGENVSRDNVKSASWSSK